MRKKALKNITDGRHSLCHILPLILLYMYYLAAHSYSRLLYTCWLFYSMKNFIM